MPAQTHTPQLPVKQEEKTAHKPLFGLRLPPIPRQVEVEKNQSFLDRLRQNERRSRTRRIIAAVGLGILGVFLGFAIRLISGIPSVYMVLLLSVLLSTWYGGLKTGLLTAIIVALSSDYFFTPPLYQFSKTSLRDLVDFAVFIVGCLIMSYLIELARQRDLVREYKAREKEYVKLLSQMQKERDKAVAEVKARDEFLSIASHEIKTPITAMVMQMQTALHNIRNVSLANFSVENLMHMLESAESQSKRVSKMINDLLNVSLITTGRIDLDREEVDLGKVTKMVLHSFEKRFEQEGCHLETDIQDGVVGHWDRVRIEQVITNLISNAIKYGKAAPIFVSVKKHGSTAELCVKDQGIGIPQSQQEKIFGRFERAVDGHKFEGLGVGLYITAQIVKAHEGKIRVESSEGHGSTFIVELPLKVK